MKLTLALTAILLMAAFLLTAADPAAASYFGHDEIAGKLAKGGAITGNSAFTVSASHRDKGGQVEVHDKETDIFYVTDGAATFITGGTMVGGKVTKPNQWNGTDIKGGVTHNLSKGDVLVIPAGTPHWFKAVPNTVSYFVVKVLKP